MATNQSSEVLCGPGLRTGRHTCRLSDREADFGLRMESPETRDQSRVLCHYLILRVVKALEPEGATALCVVVTGDNARLLPVHCTAGQARQWHPTVKSRVAKNRCGIRSADHYNETRLLIAEFGLRIGELKRAVGLNAEDAELRRGPRRFSFFEIDSASLRDSLGPLRLILPGQKSLWNSFRRSLQWGCSLVLVRSGGPFDCGMRIGECGLLNRRKQRKQRAV